MLPKKLTSASRKHSPQPPEKSHRRLLETLTDVSRTSSPIAPASAHRGVPERLTGLSRRGSPTLPGKAHRTLPYRLTTLPCKSSPAVPEKSHLGDGLELASPECGHEPVHAHRLKRLRKVTIAARCMRLRAPCVRRDIAAIDRSDMLAVASVRRPLWRYLHSSLKSRHGGTSQHRRHALPSSVEPRTDTYGCSFILKPTTPGSSVVDTANPHAFASEIIAEFSRSASPTIHAVPRARA